jgi:uncharacterized protein YjbI with pentapeptide repeats
MSESTRKPYEESCKVLIAEGLIDEPSPPLPSRMPAYSDDAPLGVSFFRMHLEDKQLSALTLPRSFFGRSLVARCSWADTDLSESCLCWNDFEVCDFTGASLARADLRASNYEDCRFDRADLSGADLRGSSFERCSFEGARVQGARVTEEQLQLFDDAQRSLLSVESEDDPPDGG